MKVFVFTCYFIIWITSSEAQVTSHKLTAPNESSIVTCITKEATFFFGKAEMIKAYERSIRDDEFQKVLNFLKSNNESITVKEGRYNNETEKGIFDLIQQRLATYLIVSGGIVGILRHSDNRQQTTVLLKNEGISLMGKSYSFLFEGDKKLFFNALQVGPAEQVAQDVALEVAPVEVRSSTPADDILTIVSVTPNPPQGMKAFYDYLSKNLNYPTQAKEEKLEGRVFVEFVVEKDGSLSNFKIVKGLSAECNEEAIRLIKEGGKWTPGKNQDELKRVRFVQSVIFSLQEKQEN